MSVPKKTRRKIYGRGEGNRIDKSDTATPWMVNNIIFCYDREKHTGNDSKRKQHFLEHQANHSNFKEARNLH